MAYLPYFLTHLRNIFLFPLILKLHFRPLSLSRLKQLERHFPRAPAPHLSLERGRALQASGPTTLFVGYSLSPSRLMAPTMLPSLPQE